MPITVPPFNSARGPSITSPGSLLRLASVRFCARPCSSRKLSRNSLSAETSGVSTNMPESNHIPADFGIFRKDSFRLNASKTSGYKAVRIIL